MHWDDLRYVLAVGRAGSLGAAARTLGVAHSTVYRRINQFEEQHRVRCFIKVADGFELSEAGKQLLRLAEEVEERMVEAERCLTGQSESVSGEVVVAAPEAVGLMLCPHLPQFQARYPGLTTHWRLSADKLNVQRGEADVALRVTRAPAPSLVGRKLVDLAFAIYASKSYTEKHPWRSIESARWIVFDDLLMASPQFKWEQRHVPPEQISMKVDRRVMLDEAVRAGLGVGILPCGDAARYPNMVRLSDPLPELALPLWILTHEDLRNAAGVRAVMDFCGEQIDAAAALLEGSDLEPLGS
jgi:DNA-binding transcriptional LysR family regulator